MKRFHVVAALLFLALPIEAQTGIEQAKNLMTNENYADARKSLTQYIGAEKDLLKQAEAYYWLGECDYQDIVLDKQSNPADIAKGLAAAREQYNKGIAIAKNSPHCLVGMGKLLLDAKNGKEALKTFDQAIRESRKKPYKEGHPEIFMLIGDAYLYSTNPNAEQAVSNYNRAKEIEPKDARFWIKAGDGSLAKGDAGSAMNAYETASQKDKNNADLYLKRARIWMRASKYDLALEEINNGLKLNDKYALLYKDLIEVLVITKKFDKVLPALEKYVPLAGSDYSARRRLVTFLTYQAKDYDRAIVEADKLLKDDPTQTTMHRWLAWAKFAKGDTLVARQADKKIISDTAKIVYQQSIDASKKLFELVPTDRLVYYDYEFPAKANLRLGKLDEATALFKKVLTIDSTKTCDVYTQLIQANYDAKKFKEGLDLLEEKETKCPVTDKNRDYYYAMYYGFTAKLYDKAAKYADKYAEAFPLLTDGYYYKAQSLNEQDTEPPTWKAKEAYEKVVAVYEAKPADRAKTQVARAYNYLGTYYGSQQDLVKAKEFFNKTILVEPTNKLGIEMLKQLGNN